MDVFDRLYTRLLEAVRRDTPAPLERTLTIAEIYQQLVPYRQVRTDLGFTELAEYESTLMRLLAGERGYLRVELPKVREEIQRELKSAHPILGLYRDYAAVEVRLTAASAEAGERKATAAVQSKPKAEPERGTREHDEPAAAAVEPAAQLPFLTFPPVMKEEPTPLSKAADRSRSSSADAQAERSAAPSARAARPPACRQCGTHHPHGVDVRFCPHCGLVQVPLPCTECSTPVEPGWNYCVQCGVAARTSAGEPSGTSPRPAADS